MCVCALCVCGYVAAGRCVAVRGLTKEFDTPDGVKRAVDGVDLTMYEGQIFALLGHNGVYVCVSEVGYVSILVWICVYLSVYGCVSI